MKSLLTLAVICLFPFCVTAQDEAIDKVQRIISDDLEAIRDGETVKGYFIFYQIDKSGSKENLYSLITYDEKLKELNSRNFKLPLNQKVLKSHHNGTGICLQLINTGASQYEYIFLDDDLKESGSFIQKIPKEVAVNQALHSRYHTVLPLPGIGFGIQGIDPQSKKWELHAHNTKGELIWKQGSGNNDKWKTEVIFALSGTTRNVALFETYTKFEKKKNVSRYFIRLLDDHTGQEVFKTEIRPLHPVSFTTLLEMGSNYLLIGKYTDKKNPSVAGDLLINLSSSGKIQTEKYIVFTEAVLAAREGQENRATFLNKSVGIREVKMIDRSYFLIADLFDRKENGLAGQDPVNMAVFELNKDLDFKDFFLLENTGSPTTKNRFLYSTQDGKESAFTMFFDRVLDPNSDNIIIGSSTYSRGKIKPGDVKMFLGAPDYKVLQALPDKLVIFEHYQREKKVNLRMEKF